MPFPSLFGLHKRHPARSCLERLRLWFMSQSVLVPHNVCDERPRKSGRKPALKRSARSHGWAASSLYAPKEADSRRYGEKTDYPEAHLSRTAFELESKPLEFHWPSRMTERNNYEGSQQRSKR